MSVSALYIVIMQRGVMKELVIGFFINDTQLQMTHSSG